MLEHKHMLCVHFYLVLPCVTLCYLVASKTLDLFFVGLHVAQLFWVVLVLFIMLLILVVVVMRILRNSLDTIA